MGEVIKIEKEETPTFEDFWAIYPRHQSKKDARKAWERIDPSLYGTIITAAYHWRAHWLKRGELQYVPHAARWLNGERWEDEIQSYVNSAPTTSAKAGGSDGKREPMPQYVKDLVAKMRSK